MQRMFRWLAAVVLCCWVGTASGEAKPGARLEAAQKAYSEAMTLYEAGKYAEAVTRGEDALTRWEAELGGASPDVARCVDLLGLLHWLQGDFDRAEPLFQRGLEIREKAFGKDHPDVADSLNHLANLYIQQGRYTRAQQLHERALTIREAAFGKDHPNVAGSLNNLATAYKSQGFFERAEPLYQRALAIREAVQGKNHLKVTGPLSNLANLYVEQGLYGRAEPLYLRAIAIREAAQGKNHPDLVSVLHNLALVYLAQELHERAELLFRRAVAIQEAALSKNHPELAMTLTNLADLYASQGLLGRAEPLFQRALTILESVPGNNHRNVASLLHDLARLYLEQGLYDRAEPLFLRALAVQETALGKDHPALAQTLNTFAQLRLAQHRLDDALPLYTRAFAISEHRLRQEALDFSESRLGSFLQYLRADEQGLYALLRAHPGDARVRRLALGSVLLHKGRSVEETADISRTLYRSLDAEALDILERLRGLRTRLASFSLADPGALSPTEYQQRLKALADEGDALEAELARRSAPLRGRTALPPPDKIVDRVAASLPQDGVLIEFIAYVDRPLVPKPGMARVKRPGTLRYLALVLFPDATTRALDLGPAAPIDRAATRLRDALARRDARFEASAQALYRLAFQPLRPLLGNRRRLFLSPDAQLSLVPFDALHDGRHFLLDAFDFTYLTSGKELLPRTWDSRPASSIVVLADPDFHASAETPPQALGPTPAHDERSASLGRFSALRAGLAATPWTALPGSRQEAESIKRLLPQAELFLGPEATKQRLFLLPTPGVLHLATHGFFLEDASAPRGSRAVVSFGGLGNGAPRDHPPDPLLRSGLVLAGAPAPASGTLDAASASADRTMVTALELAGLNLWGTQLVVLAACDTGRGDVRLGQGVFGLRRAFVVAGAETVVMSLWKVNDAKTGTLMEAYYRNLLAGQGRATALREAMREFQRIQPHPHYWAPFIAVGSDAPLHALAPRPQQAPDLSPPRGP
ncbi:CHAT domain-containing tetratricopeptide repeat protein [Corallococcus aberystwythensis]|uniref:CHAT domain-containing protein n=1 Tax=Corallococcus aberystwythensis TaxID=2316722 RepID=A0A3A8R313_9BACT|nr:CHAT domain-containing tetratricopeptide repeat protein [Corallococcus aberystwythensis]RKH74358.1 CHAT domain-containing protein [Corallococcus aberystwythensis]